MKKVYIKRTIKFFIAISIILSVTFFTQNRFDHNSTRLKGFYLEDKNSIDVVMMGASEVHTGFAPGQAFKEYGFTSYPYAVEQNTVDLYKNELIDILNYQNPKLLVIEVNGALYDSEQTLANDANVRRITDCMPMSENKVNTINEFGDKDNLLSYYLPFIKYHGHLSSFKYCWNDFMLSVNGVSYLKGITTETIARECETIKIKDIDGKEDLNPAAEEKFREFLEYCKNNVETEILFVRFPHAITTEKLYHRYLMGNRIGEIINEYGYQYMNFEKSVDEIGFDFNRDFYSDDHMNVRGQQKFTSYFAEFLVEKYNLTPTHLTNEQKEIWDKSSEYTYRYYDYAESCMENNQDLWLFEDIDVMNKIK